jgi:hypothetical protein
VTLAAKHPVLTCFLGDIFEPCSADIGGALQKDMSVFDQQIWELFNGQDATLSAAAGVGNRQYCSRSPAALSSLLFAWNDTQAGSDTGLKAEEVVHKQFSYDTRKYEKKMKDRQEKEAAALASGQAKASSKRSLGPPPVFNRPQMSATFSAMVKDLPMVYAEENVRHLYRSFLLGPNVEVFVLDNRNGYMGKEQIRWLKDGLRKSSAVMKIVFTGKSFGLNLVNMAEEEPLGLEVSQSVEEGYVQGEAEEEEEGEEEEDKDKEEPAAVVTISSDAMGDDSKDKKEKEKMERKISSSRKRALEATQEEFDEYGISKSTLQHAVINTYRHMFPNGYEVPEPEVGDDFNDEDSDEIFRHDTEVSPLNSGRGELGEPDGEGEGWGTEEEADIESIQLLGGVLVVSASSAADSAVSSFSFNDAPPFGKAFCAEVSVGSAYCKPGQVCRAVSFKSVAVEKMLTMGRRDMFRASVHDTETMEPDAAEVLMQLENPLVSSLTVRSDGTVKVQLREYGTGRTLFRILFKPPEAKSNDDE